MATGFVKNLVGFSSESIINFIISFITVPIATRLFAPDAYGQVIMLQSVVLLCVVLPQFGQDQAFARFFHESKDKNRLLNINLTVVLVAWSFVMMGSVIFSRILSVKIFREVNGTAIILAAYTLLPMSLIRMSLMVYRMQIKIKSYIAQSVIYNTLIKAAILCTGFLRSDYNMYAFLLAGMMTAFAILCLLGQYRKNKVSFCGTVKMQEIKPFLIFGFPAVIAAFLFQLQSFLPRYLLSSSVGFMELGIYSASVSLASTINVVQAGFSSYFGPYLYGHYEQDRGQINYIHHTMSYLCFLAVCGLTLFSGIIVKLLGEKYAGAQTVFPVLLIYLICVTLSETTVYGINIAKKMYLHIVVSALTVGSVFAFCIILIPKLGVLGAAISYSASALVFLASRTYWGLKYFKPIKNGGVTVAMLVAASAVTLINIWLDGETLKKTLAILAIVAVMSCVYLPLLKKRLADWKTLEKKK